MNFHEGEIHTRNSGHNSGMDSQNPHTQFGDLERADERGWREGWWGGAEERG